jgi:predicted ABC-type ATPase
MTGNDPNVATGPRVIVLAGPNGAGKSTAAPFLLRDELRVGTYVDADVIARGLAAFAAAGTAREAGGVMLAWLDRLQAARRSFAFESTLAGRTAARRIRSLVENGYDVRIFYLWLPSPDLAVERVQLRARHGGHAVPEPVIRRRYHRSLRNFAGLHAPLVTAWYVYDARGRPDAGLPLVARGRADRVMEIRDAGTWSQVSRRTHLVREVTASPYAREQDDVALQHRLDAAMSRAYCAAVRLHRLHGLPLAVWIDGQVRHIDAREVRLPRAAESHDCP